METIVNKRLDSAGIWRFYVLPVESRNAFIDLLKFVAQKFSCQLAEMDEGPGTLVQKGIVEGVPIAFVLSDQTGSQFYSETVEGVAVAEKIAEVIEQRISELTKLSFPKAHRL